MDDTNSTGEATVRQKLQKAYVWMNFGHYRRAMAICEEVERSSEPSVLAGALHGAILSASGRPVEAMKHLMPLHRRHPNAPSCALYLAEACFLAGRNRRGWKILDHIEPHIVADGPWEALFKQLKLTWEQLEEHEQTGPLTVPFDNDHGQSTGEQQGDR